MIVRAALDPAVDRQLVVRNIATSAQLKVPRAGGPIARSWTASERAIFLATARHHRLYPALHVAAHTGCAEERLSVSSGATSTRWSVGCRSGVQFNASAGNPSSSASRLAPADAQSSSTERRFASCGDGAMGFNATAGASRAASTTGCSVTQAAVSSTHNRSRSCLTPSFAVPSFRGSGSTTCDTRTPPCSSRPVSRSRSSASWRGSADRANDVAAAPISGGIGRGGPALLPVGSDTPPVHVPCVWAPTSRVLDAGPSTSLAINRCERRSRRSVAPAPGARAWPSTVSN